MSVLPQLKKNVCVCMNWVGGSSKLYGDFSQVKGRYMVISPINLCFKQVVDICQCLWGWVHLGRLR